MGRFGMLKAGSLLLLAVLQALWLLQPIPLGLKLASLAFLALAMWRPGWVCLLTAAVGPVAHAIVSAFSAQTLGARLFEQFVLAVITGVLIKRRPKSEFSTTSFASVIVGLIAIFSAASVVPARIVQSEATWSDWWNLIHTWTTAYFGPTVPSGAVAFALLLVESLALAWAIETLVRDDRTLPRNLGLCLVIGHAAAATINLQEAVTMARSAGESARGFFQLLARARVSTQYDRNAAGSAFTAVFLTGLMFLWGSWRQKIGAAVLLAIIACGGVWLTGSRSALLSLIIVGACVMGTRLIGPGRMPVKTVAALAMFVVVASTLYLALAPASVHASLRDSLGGRLYMGGVALRMLRASPTFGAGIGMFFEQSTMFGSPVAENAHNNLLQILAEQGLVGFLAFAAFLIVVFGHAVRQAISRRNLTLVCYASGVAGFMLTWLTGHPLLEPDAAFVFWILLGATAGLSPARPAPARSARWLALVIAVLLVSLPIRAAAVAGAIDMNDVGINLSASAKGEDGQSFRRCTGDCSVYAQGNSFAVVPLRKSASARAPVRVEVRSRGRLVQSVDLTGSEWRQVSVLIPAKTRRYEPIELHLVTQNGDAVSVDVGHVESHSAAGNQTQDATPEAVARRCVADVWERQTDADAALEHCEHAVREYPQSPELHEALGRLLFYRLSRRDEGLAAYREAVTLRARAIPVFRQELDWGAIAHALEISGAFDEAVAILDAQNVRGDVADAIRARRLQAAGKFTDAIAMYWRAIAQNDHDPWYFHNLAMAYLSSGDRAGARHAWQRALNIDPAFQPALSGLKSLR